MTITDNLPLEGLLVLDMAQFLSGPYAALRLMDLGARVIKIERPDGGDLARRLYLTDTEIGGDSTNFHAINRNKQSIALDLKNARDIGRLWKLIAKADVIIQNFRPGVIERLGLDYETVAKRNPRLVYGSISGYGEQGPWVTLPGQDLLAQARSGLMWLSGDDDHGPVPFGLSVGDMLAGADLVQGILAALVRRGVSGQGAHVQTSLLEALVDLQFEVLTAHLNDGNRLPKRSSFRNAQAYLAAPYGVYETADGYMALAMTPIGKVADLLEIAELHAHRDLPKSWFSERDKIKRLIADRLKMQTTEHWLASLQPADVWCARVLNWRELLTSEGFASLDMLQTVSRGDGVTVTTTRSPIRINGKRRKVEEAAPTIGAHSEAIIREFDL
ncbi:MAG: CaiB/BaiF CoA-transferase family protein [Devosia sp.]